MHWQWVSTEVVIKIIIYGLRRGFETHLLLNALRLDGWFGSGLWWSVQARLGVAWFFLYAS